MSNKFINFNWEAGNYESKKLKKFIPYRNGNFKDIIENELRRRAHEKFEAGLTLASDISVDELDYYNCRELIELYLDIGNIERTETDSTTDIMAAFYEKVKHGKDATKDIVVTPNAGYKVDKILVNGEEQQYNEGANGVVILPKFTNVKEDKLVMATFSPIENIGYVHVKFSG